MTRLQRLAAALSSMDNHVDALLITHPQDVRYLTGFTGSNAALVVMLRSGSERKSSTKSSRSTPNMLFTDGRYMEQARQQTKGAGVTISRGPVLREACAWMREKRIRCCAFDTEHTTVAALEAMRASIDSKLRRNFFTPVGPLTARLRQVKDSAEIVHLRAAARLGCCLFDRMLTFIESGKQEVEVAAHLEFEARIAGAEAMSFETIVASGPRSALPHGHASTQHLPQRGFVVLDFGVMLMGYCSDMTRTVHMGIPTTRERSAYDAVLEAQMSAIAAIKPGVTCAEVDEAARSVLRRVKLAQFFTHSTGHGVGLEIHEGPRIAAHQTQELEPGMVVTVEPGIYLPGRFGIRIEDMVLVTKTGAESLTSSPKGWIEL